MISVSSSKGFARLFTCDVRTSKPCRKSLPRQLRSLARPELHPELMHRALLLLLARILQPLPRILKSAPDFDGVFLRSALHHLFLPGWRNTATMKDKDMQKDLQKQLDVLKKRQAEALAQMQEAAAALSIREVDARV